MIEFGQTLREAREAKGYTVAQVAEMTRIIPQIVTDLEQEDFSRIVAPIYGRGFVKLYCETVGLDPKPMIDEFMAIFSGNRAPVIRRREAPAAAPAPPSATTPEPPAEPVAAEPPAAAPISEDLFAAPAATAAEPAEPDESPEPSAPIPPPRTFARYAPPRPTEAPKPSFGLSLPPNFWRIFIVAAAALTLLILLIAGVKAAYRATMTPAGEEPAVTENSETPATTPAADGGVTPNTPRTPIKVEPLYLD